MWIHVDCGSIGAKVRDRWIELRFYCKKRCLQKIHLSFCEDIRATLETWDYLDAWEENYVKDWMPRVSAKVTGVHRFRVKRAERPNLKNAILITANDLTIKVMGP